MGIRAIALAGVCAASLALGTALPDSVAAQPGGPRVESAATTLREGDVLVHHDEDGWSTVKIIAVDRWPDGSGVAHCLMYVPTPDKPAPASLAGLRILALHAPIRASAFDGWERIAGGAVTKGESAGFVEYLKRTDFRRYAKHTGQDYRQLISRANRHYASANALNEAGRRIEAIAEYDKAVDLFPLFFEAIDNRAFSLMELGRYREAFTGFEQSLDVNPKGVHAFFSKGECLMKLGELAAAEAIFLEGQTLFPERRQLFTEFLGKVRAMRAGAN